MSPRDLVIATQRTHTGDTIENYTLPSTELLGAGRMSRVPQRKTLTIIAEEAKKKSLIPSPSTYSIKPLDNWGPGGSVNNGNTLPKAKRMTESEMIEHRNKSPEKCTPSPLAYKPNVDQILQKMGPGHVSLRE